MNRGYSGFYRGVFLRSSYEYAYVKYLDFHNINWKYEEKQFSLTKQTYKPDFFIYSNGELKKIVEIKSQDKRSINKAIELLKEITQNFKIETELLTYKDLRFLYQSMPYSLNSVISEWNNSPLTKISKKIYGKNNPHFNHIHSPETKKIIGEHTKNLWKTDSIAKRRMLEGLRKSGLVQKGKIKVPRENRKCQTCQRTFIALVTSTQRFCNQKCSGTHNIILATEKYVSKRNSVMKDIKNFVIDWTSNNKVIVECTPYNKISTNLAPLLDEIYSRYDVKDIRVISKAVFGVDKGRKELLGFMKNLLTKQ